MVQPPIKGFFGEYRFLSNFWPANISILGIPYMSVEAAYQASKTANIEIRKNFSHMDPKRAKHMGRKVTLRPNWDDITKIESMELCLRAKFNIPVLRDRLLSTGDADLIEDNNWGDQFWGVSKGSGRNILGKLLVNIRDELIQYEAYNLASDDSTYIPF